MLSEKIYPKKYNLIIEIDLKNFKFFGKEEIELEIKEETELIVLNSVELKINKILFNNKEVKFKENKKEETLEIKISEKALGNNFLYIEFEGEIKDNLIGLYRSKTDDGKYIATTQLEATFARRVFPCFDEPKFKSVFNLTLIIDKDLIGISNMPIEREETFENRKIVKFYETKPMPTYLLYIGVGEFEILESEDKRIRIVTQRGKSNLGKSSLEFAKKCLKFFEEYTNIKYPLPKLDLIAVPDFGAGAMENWGAITFREILLLFDEKKVSEKLKLRSFEVIAHEIWHQWSGNLVTMYNWDDLWLNESFATYMAFKALENLIPNINIWEIFVDSETNAAMIRDSLKSTHPIKFQVKKPSEIEEIFDEISYNKGASILRMIENYIGKENFQNSIRNFLNKFSYSNATAEDFFNCFEEDVKKIIEAWIKKDGYPLVEVKYKNNKVSIYQKRFCYKSKDKFRWPLPLEITTNLKTLKILLDTKSYKINLEGKPDFIILNKELKSFCRVKYSEKILKSLKPLIFKKEIDSITRFAILNDYFAYTFINKINLKDYLNFLSCFEFEDNWLVLSTIASSIFKIYRDFEIEKKFLKEKFKSIFSKNFEKLGFEVKEGETLNEILAREISAKYLAFCEDENIKTKCFELFENFEELNQNIKNFVLFSVSYNGNKNYFEKMLELYEKVKNLEDKRILLANLANFRDEKILNEFLNYSLEKVRLQDLRIVFPSVSLNPLSRKIFFDFVKDNLEKIKKFENTTFVFRDFLFSLITCYKGEILDEIENFVKKNFKKYKLTINYALEIAKLNTIWINKNKNFLNELQFH